MFNTVRRTAEHVTLEAVLAVNDGRSDTTPVADGLFEVTGDALLFRCGRCRGCGHVAFPAPMACPSCTTGEIAVHRVLGVGELWTYTVQMFRPKPPYAGPARFEPFGVGYVKLGDDLMIEGRLTVNEPRHLAIGMPMRAVTHDLGSDDGGTGIATFAFAPSSGHSR